MSRMIAALCICFASTLAFAAEPSKLALASAFYDATTAKQIDAMTRNAADAILREDPSKIRQSEIYRQWAYESFSSPAYKKIYVQFLVENFSAGELKAMNVWAKDQNFLSYMKKWQQFPQWSIPKFQEFMKLKQPELSRRLTAEGFSAN